MKVTLKNIGVFKQAEYELGDLTIICGENNTGKTYATYSLYGFYDYWKKGYIIKISESYISNLMETGSLIISLDNININDEIKNACVKYSKILPKILAAQEKYFDNSSFVISLDDNDVSILDNYEEKWGTTKNEIIQITKESGKNEITVSLLMNSIDANNESVRRNLSNVIGKALKKIIFSNTFSDIFIASAERTGAVIFRNELNIEKNILLKEAAGSDEIDFNEILRKVYNSAYALPVKDNINFIRILEDIGKSTSEITKLHPEILSDFADIIGGEYKVGKEGLYFIPKSNKSVKLTMGESSSSVRSLLDISFYLKYAAEKGDMLIIDEPELNLHPSNQRKLAKLIARLVNMGIKVFITTHSDYIIKELNTLIMFNKKKDEDNSMHLMNKFGYKETELINHEQVKVYISCKEKVQLDGKLKKTTVQTLIPAEIDDFYGIEAQSFDKTIDEMNTIQKSIIFGRK